METWLKLSLILCFFGFLKEIRPSEPFVYEYLTGPWRNISGDEIVTKVYPVATYSYLVLLVVIFFITDLLKYRPLINVLGISGIAFSSMLIWTTSLLSLQILEVFYSIFMASEVAYYTYIYAKVEKDYYQLVTSHTRASLLAGRFISGVLSQILISWNLMDYKELNYVTLAAMILATFWSFFIPKVKKSIYFNNEEMNGKQNRITVGIRKIRTEVGDYLKNKSILTWSAWYALGTCIFLQVQSYEQPLWKEITQESSQENYNGAIEAILTMLGFFGALLAGVLKINWSSKGPILRIVLTIFQGIVLIIGANTGNVFICYACYIIFCVLYHFVITVTSSEIAKKIQGETFGLIFGFNTFIAMIFQSLLTLFVVNDVLKLYLSVRQQFQIYGCFCFLIVILDLLSVSLKFLWKE